MAKIKGTPVLAPVVPFDTADVHPSHEARYGKGGYRTVATLSERDAIPAPRREAGMLVFVTASGGSLWQLSGDLTTWTAFASGGGVVGPAGPQGPPGQAGAKGDKGDPGDPATNLVSSVAGRTGAVTLGKSDVGLGNVDNTSDASKPVSTAMQNALDGKAAASHTHTIADVTGLQTALDGKQASGSYASATHGHSISDVTGLQTALDGKQAAGSYAAATHGHAIGDVTGLQTALDGKAATSHTHAADAIQSGTIAVARLPIVLEQTQAVGNSGTSTTLALTTGSVQTVTLNASCAFTMPAATAGASITLILTQSGTFTATFASVLWAGGTAPTITATTNKRDILVFVSDGTNWYGTAAQNF